jgi:hypothetical protein
MLIFSQLGAFLKLEQLLLRLEGLLSHVADGERETETYHTQDAHSHQKTSIGVYVFYRN